MTLQALYGTIPQIFGKGDCARVIVFNVKICAELKHLTACLEMCIIAFCFEKYCSVFPQHVANMMLRMKREFAGIQNQILPVFDTLLLLDRNVDLLTPLATQLTYEGLIDEIYGIHNGQKMLI